VATASVKVEEEEAKIVSRDMAAADERVSSSRSGSGWLSLPRGINVVVVVVVVVCDGEEAAADEVPRRDGRRQISTATREHG